MKAITQNDLAHLTYVEQSTYSVNKSIWSRFIKYAEAQQPKRFWWLAFGILGHGTIFTIATLAAVTLLGNNFALYTIACFVMVMVLVVNLAGLTTKYLIPIFYLSLLIDMGVIIAAFALH